MRCRVALVLFAGALCVLSAGCVSLRTYEKQEYAELERQLTGAGLETEKAKDPILAACLNLLPGFGNAYLEQWGPFVGNLLFWPVSCVWGVPQAYIDANTLNKQETLYYYQRGPGKERLEKAQLAQK